MTSQLAFSALGRVRALCSLPRACTLMLFAGLALSGCGSDGDPMRGDGGMDDGSMMMMDDMSVRDLGPDTGPNLCGNGVLDTGEVCDDRNSLNGDGCSGDCTTIGANFTCVVGMLCARCGDGEVGAGEACDDGMTPAGNDGCAADCRSIEAEFNCPMEGEACERCGNGMREAFEGCDDGNYMDEDGCGLDCQVEPGFSCPVVDAECEECGDSVIDTFEACDDGGFVAGDGCSDVCQVEPGWDCSFDVCVAAECGDGIRAGAETCDDGGRISGDGCSFLCRTEPGFVCITAGTPCRATVCGDSAVEAQEQCDDGDALPLDGCDEDCQIEPNFQCPTPGADCVVAVCGNGVIEGIESCDDMNNAAPGCSAACQLEPGFNCPTAGAACVATDCGDGVLEGTEECDDCNEDDNDGCSSACALEPFFECAAVANSCSMSGLCAPITRYVRIAEFPAPMAQPQAVHYDPLTRSFIAYGFAPAQGYQEVCLDGTLVPPMTRNRPRALIGGSLDGSTYDPFNDRWLFIQQSGELNEVERVVNGENPDCVVQPPVGEFCLVAAPRTLPGLGTAGGIAVGDDGRLYACNHFTETIQVFERFGSVVVQSIPAPTDGPYLDNLYTLPGEGLIGYYNRPPGAGAGDQRFSFHRYDGTLVGRSAIPGTLFLNGRPFPANSDGGEAAPDGGFFLVCSEYLTNGGMSNGICQLFSRACTADVECASRVPGTACKLDAMETEGVPPYCFAPTSARDDAYSVAINSANHDLDVLRNDTRSASVCTGSPVSILSVTPPSLGGSVMIAVGDGSLIYTPLAGACGGVETFEYTADLGGETDTAVVRVLIECVCGDDITQANEQCDDGGNEPGDGCSPTCRFEPACGNDRLDVGEQCDDGNVVPDDGCSPTCTLEFG